MPVVSNRITLQFQNKTVTGLTDYVCFFLQEYQVWCFSLKVYDGYKCAVANNLITAHHPSWT